MLAKLPAFARMGFHKHADLWGVLLLVLLTVGAARKLVVGGTAVGMDAATFFYPMYSLLGKHLRAGDLLEWNPYQLSGTPFAADLQSGWMYLPAMGLFTLLPMDLAAKGYLLLHLVLPSVSVYLLARALRMGVPASLAAAITYAHSGYMYDRAVRCFACSGIAAWLPVALLGAELAIRSRGWPGRLFGWGVAGLAVSQALAVWLGQGSYYLLLALGAFIGYRTLLSPPDAVPRIRSRILWAALHGIVVLAFGFGLAAAGLLPRLEYNLFSNLAGGYGGPDEQAAVGGLRIGDWSLLLTRGYWYYAGSVSLALAVLAPFFARTRFAVPYWTVLSLGALILTLKGPTPLHSLLYLLPAFERLHPHHPERIIMLALLGMAVLTGAAVDYLARRADSRAFPMSLLGAGLALSVLSGFWFSSPMPAVLAILLVLIAAYSALSGRRHIALALLLAVILADLSTSAGSFFALRKSAEGPSLIQNMDLGSYYAPGGAAKFLISRKKLEGQFRYLGYDPRIGGRARPYQAQFADPRPASLSVNNRSILLGLHDIQGYNPIHLKRYEEFMEVINGRSQGYRQGYVFEDGVTSELLDLLNTRYIVVPRWTPPTREDLKRLNKMHATVYTGSETRVLERTSAMPRAWIVHSAQQVEPGRALELLGSGDIDFRETALLEQPAPPLDRVADPSADRVSIGQYRPSFIRVRTSSDGAGLLVLSEVYYPAWKAYVDGRPAPLYVANHVLRAVPVPAGQHTVELRYESATLHTGLGISLAFCGALLMFATGVLVRVGRLQLQKRVGGKGKTKSELSA